jgi:hypothetical protein
MKQAMLIVDDGMGLQVQDIAGAKNITLPRRFSADA